MFKCFFLFFIIIFRLNQIVVFTKAEEFQFLCFMTLNPFFLFHENIIGRKLMEDKIFNQNHDIKIVFLFCILT